MMDTEKLCTTAKVMVEKTKNPKHHHTTGKRKKDRLVLELVDRLAAGAGWRWGAVYKCAR
jgi:hypothetical protein